MNRQLTDYRTLIFDCDGVVLDSNKVKTKAFYEATLPYGQAMAQAMVDHHVGNGGVSRYKKFAHFLAQIAQVRVEHQGSALEVLLEAYARLVREGLFSCDTAPGLGELRQKASGTRWLIVSGGDQAELREVFAKRGIADWFDGGIFGSPETKEDILAREITAGLIPKPALFLGDSKYDFEVAKAAGLDFLFVSGWSEVSDWQNWTVLERITSCQNLNYLLKSGQ